MSWTSILMKAAALALIVASFFETPLGAQTIQVRQKPGSQGWQVSYSRVFSPSVLELDSTHATLSAARRAAAALQAWSKQMDPNSDWRVAVIVIEGADAEPPSRATEEAKAAAGSNPAADPNAGPLISSFMEAVELVKTAKNLVDDPLEALRDKLTPEMGLKDYAKTIQKSYELAKDVKEGAMKLTAATAGKDFAQVNALIDKYNNDVSAFAKVEVKGALPKMTPVDEETMKKADEWRKAKKAQFKLELDKDRLDAARERLEKEREALLEDCQRAGTPTPPELTRRAQLYRKDLDEYEEERTEYEGEFKKISPILTRVEVKEGKNAEKDSKEVEQDDLVGTTWTFGMWVSHSFKTNGVLKYKYFVDGGFKTFEDGTWTRNGNQLQMTLPKMAFGHNYVGEIQASRIGVTRYLDGKVTNRETWDRQN